MKLLRNSRAARQGGFSLIELLLVIAILGLVVGAVFSQVGVAQQRLNAEEIKLDDFQQARDFVDQFFRDINQAGSPNIRMYDPTSAGFTQFATPYNTYDSRLAVGLVSIGTNAITFEGAVNGIGTVQSVTYKINGAGTCTYCLFRSQVDKANNTSPTAQGTNWGTEVNDVDLTKAIFRYFQYDGTEITSLPKDISTDAATIANVKTIQINLTIRNPNVIDQQTGLPIETTFEGEISLNNCSMASVGQPMSCQ